MTPRKPPDPLQPWVEFAETVRQRLWLHTPAHSPSPITVYGRRTGNTVLEEPNPGLKPKHPDDIIAVYYLPGPPGSSGAVALGELNLSLSLRTAAPLQPLPEVADAAALMLLGSPIPPIYTRLGYSFNPNTPGKDQ